MTPEWIEHLFGHARHAATKSKDSTQVGAVLTDDNRVSLLACYNGPPIGVLDKPERRIAPVKYLFVAHAEQNIIAFAARRGLRTEGLTLFVTHLCCDGCAKLVIQAGIKSVYIGPGKTKMPVQQFEAAALMFKEAGVSMFCSPGTEWDFI